MNKKEGIKTLLRYPKAVIMDGIRAQVQTYYKDKTISQYNIQQLPTIDFLDLFPDLDEEINTYSFLNGTSLITDLILLKSLARKYKQCEYIEIGSWRGESLANISDVTDNCTSLSLSEKEMSEMNLGQDFIDIHGIFSNKINTITKIEHNSHTYDFNKLNKKFDLIFIDGDHSYKGVLNDTKKTFNLRKNDNSVIVWHDYGFHTENVRHSTLKAILDGIPKDKHKNLFHVSNTMCAIYIENTNFDTYLTKLPTFPNKVFSLNITAKKI